jgi:hypothetical protein
MLPSMNPTTDRARIRNEREYREWQRSLQGLVPVRRFKNEPGFLTRLGRLIRRVRARRPGPIVDLRRTEQA